MKLTTLRRRMRRLLESVDASAAAASAAAALSDLERQVRTEEMFARAAVLGVTGTLEELAARSSIGEHYDVTELSDGERACRVAVLLVRAKQRKLAAEVE
ncbi:Uncharacterised protein [Burkholderia pseudomallei]|uniref:hypothetical protein n=1 Tax=Burkholderia pseudomallei TaxID=28450 RepID=UPI000F0736A5|nr:hypothetical protein [Burkholderia pseudomallei]VCT41726.1 Uncharacterised protein [Burkholderia pseudomallei]VCT44936.1 Uncharacterised protein [Burkholderia pseudomallei]VCT49834.1 Uncharacterised protein [Burkholderia pseudomallei]VCT59364.1 Uncharacterised protein [Burkholderia pseudomallei]VCT71470.1 Uncharacterised protein [Burkholderia pseudomallei]